MDFERYTRLIQGLGVFTGAFGAAFVALPGTTAQIFDWMMFSSRSLPIPYTSQAQPYVSFVYGVLGAVMVGWGCSMVMTASSSAWKERKMEAWNSLAIPMGVWFAVDTTWSFATGFTPNCILNVAFLGVWGVALLSCRHFFMTADNKTK